MTQTTKVPLAERLRVLLVIARYQLEAKVKEWTR